MLDRPIRVLLAIGGGEFGGAEQHVLSLIHGFDSERIQVEVACFYDALFAERLRAAGIPVTIIGRNILQSFALFKKIMHTFQPDLIHTHGVRANVVGRTLGRFASVPVITTIHSKFSYDYPKRMKRIAFFGVEKATRPFVHTFIAVSESIKKDLLSERVPASKIQVIYNGIDTDYFVPSQYQRAKHSGPATVVTVARLHQVKGHKYLLEAIPHIPTPARYIFVGDGELYPELKQYIELHKLPVEMVGHQDDILSYYQQADLVAQPSLSEGFSLSMAEALACGVPVVATRVGGCVEIADRVQSGVELIPAADAGQLAEAITNMLEQSPKIDREAIVDTFSLQQMCRNTMKLYERIAAGRNGLKEK